MNFNDLSIEGLKILLILAITVLTVAIAVIGYFMSKRDSAITQATENLSRTVNQLDNIVKILGVKYEIEYNAVSEQLRIHRTDINENAAKIEVIDKDLSNLKTRHDLIHCNYPKEQMNNKPKKEKQ